SPRIGYASRPNRAIDGRGLSPPRSAALLAAPHLHAAWTVAIRGHREESEAGVRSNWWIIPCLFGTRLLRSQTWSVGPTVSAVSCAGSRNGDCSLVHASLSYIGSRRRRSRAMWTAPFTSRDNLSGTHISRGAHRLLPLHCTQPNARISAFLAGRFQH